MSGAWTPQRLRRASRLARRHERRLYLTAHPGAFLLSRAIRRRRVVRVPRVGVVVNGALETRTVLADTDTYVKNGARGAGVPITQIFGPYALLNMEGEEHRQLRLALRTLFTPAAVRELVADIVRPQAATMRAALESGESYDVVHYAKLVTGTLMTHLAGLDSDPQQLAERGLRIHQLSRRLTTKLSLSLGPLDDDELAEARAAFAEMVDGVDAAWERGDDATVAGRLRAHGVDIAGARGVVGTLMIAGTDTTTSALARMVALLCDTGQLARLRAQPDLLGGAVDETLRFTAPVPVFTRTVTRAHRLGRARLHRDQQMLVFLMNALRDHRVVERPHVYDVARTMPRELRQLWFGHGQHFCIGYAIGRQLLHDTGQLLIDLPRPVRVLERRAADDVLLPAYASLVVEMERAA